MKIVHFQYENQRYYGHLQDKSTLALIEGDIFGSFEVTSNKIPLTDIQLLPPVQPRKLIGVGLNYTEHAKESNIEQIPKEPLIFMCSPSAIIGHKETIQLHNDQDRIDYEGDSRYYQKKGKRPSA